MSERPTLFCNTGINQQMLVTFFRIYLYDISGDFQLIIFILIEKKILITFLVVSGFII